MGLYAHICNSECAAGSPTTAATAHASTLAPNWHFWRVVGRTRRKKHAVQHCPRHNLFTWASVLIFAPLNVPLGALRLQQQQQASTCALNWHFVRVVGRTRRQKHAAGHCVRDNLITRASMLISALINVPLGALRQQQQKHASTMDTHGQARQHAAKCTR